MAKYGWDDLVVKVDDTEGGSLTDMSSYITEINEISVNAINEEATTVGSTWVAHLFSGMKSTDEITLTGFYDDTASTGPDVVFNAIGETRTLEVTYGSTKKTTVETIIQTYKRMPAKEENTKFEVTLLPTGSVTEA